MGYIQQFQNAIKKATNIIITTHLHPDADGIGSEIALCLALRSIGKKAFCVNEEALQDRYHYLDPQKVVHSFMTYKKNQPLDEIDLFIVVDTNTLARVGGKLSSLAATSKNILFIDHHPGPKELAALHCIDTKMAATGELVGRLVESLKIPFTKELALPLYTAILIDTSSFRYPTVSSDTHELISKLMKTGVRPPEAYNMIYGTKKISHMQLLGTVLSSAQTTKDGAIAWLVLTENNLTKHHVDAEDTHAFVNHLLVLDNVKIACMFREDGTHVKISLRAATNTIDVGIMAQAMGGGGHNHSSATIVEGPIQTVIKETVKKLEIMLEKTAKD